MHCCEASLPGTVTLICFILASFSRKLKVRLRCYAPPLAKLYFMKFL